MNILVTGAAGFIGSFLSKALIDRGHKVIGLDNINTYYEVNLKYARLKNLGINVNDIEYGNSIASNIYKNEFIFVKLDLKDDEGLTRLFERERFSIVVNLAAQAGVRYSIENPKTYMQSNLVGFANILEACRHFNIEHLVYASSSSVYGLNKKIPFSTHDRADHPVSLYAATKKSNELMAHVYSHLYKLPTTGLRFFTVYGPWGRPDMAYFIFAEAIMKNKPIRVFNDGNMQRDFTYVDDIVDGIVRVLLHPPKANIYWDAVAGNASASSAPYKVYNIGNNQPVRLMQFINVLEEALGKVAIKEMMPMQPGDVETTFADIDELASDFQFKPSTDIKTGIKKFVEWYQGYYQN
ncbi:NAD-dependent epimerase [Parafilimonas sp.]|uniref:NAD-dependent epimerase n=1 Tax=Parafilimonas sp. TaxID=1969739 RepID=UPI003F80E876